MAKKVVQADFTIKKTEDGWFCTYFSGTCKLFENIITDNALINRIVNEIKPQNRDLLELRRQIKDQ